MIHQTAIISTKAKISENTKIGPYCIIDEGVSLGEGCELISHVHLSGNTKIGKNNNFFPFSSAGTIPQDMKYSGEDSKLVIGENNTFRENVTINPGTKHGGMITKIEDNCLFMVGSHVAHDCQISSNVILANNVTLAGQVGVVGQLTIGKDSIVASKAAVYQSLEAGSFVSGIPARPHKNRLRQDVIINQLPGILNRLRKLETKFTTI